MNTQLFRLNEDESSLVQYYRTLPEEMKSALLTLAMIQAGERFEQAGNVIAIAMRLVS